MSGSSDLTDVSGVGRQLASKFNKLGLKTVDDLIHFYPRRYDDFSKITKLRDIRPGQVTLKAHIRSASGHYLKKGLHITEALASDDSASVRLTWFNQPYRSESLSREVEYFISGHYQLRYRRFAIYNPSVEAVSDFPLNTARIVPRYQQIKGLNSRDIRKALAKLTPIMLKTKETLPDEITDSHDLMPLGSALVAIHFPESTNELVAARRRLSFEELFAMILASELNRLEALSSKAVAINFDQSIARRFVAELPFKLTDDQRKAVWQIYKDMARSRPMNRLVEGDVGSGKTAVAAMAALMVVNQGKQAVFMAPTELLARQHVDTINMMFSSIGLKDKVGLLIGAQSPAEKRTIQAHITDGSLKFIVGTHALIQEAVALPDLALVIIDEQHRFGVKQREQLKLKADSQPHTLALSATPIPRSLALTLFGELDISRLSEKPTNRSPVATKVISESALGRQITSFTKELKAGRQMFIVSPSIDSDPNYSIDTLKNWAAKQLKDYRIDVIHGRMKTDEKTAVMQRFIDHKTDILVSTTVIEVGIDVPNATMIIIFDADHFGLAQLHQLRGRVGRGQHEGRAYLVYKDNNAPSDRLRALESSSDGFKLAELDLSIRGPGAIYGQSQHGALDLRIAGLDDLALIKDAREATKYFVGSHFSLLKYQQLNKQVSRLQKLTNLN